MVSKLIKMKSTLLISFLMLAINIQSQCKPKIKIDNTEVIADMDEIYGLHLPYWLKAGQTLAIGSNVSKISVIEFSIDTASQSLNFSQVLNINSSSPQTVPTGKVWKIESIAKIYTPANYNSITYSSPGTYTFNVPSCAENICIEIWGAGGGGGSQGCLNSANCWSGGGGGGGSFGTQCFSVSPNQALTIVVGAGGGANSPGTSSSVSGGVVSITASGGNAGSNSTWGAINGAANVALGGTSTAISNCPGGSSNGTNGGAGGNGGIGGTPNSSGGFPAGGGGGGAGWNNTPGSGANGKVIISW
jgi:hypothetical protein